MYFLIENKLSRLNFHLGRCPGAVKARLRFRTLHPIIFCTSKCGIRIMCVHFVIELRWWTSKKFIVFTSIVTQRYKTAKIINIAPIGTFLPAFSWGGLLRLFQLKQSITFIIIFFFPLLLPLLNPGGYFLVKSYWGCAAGWGSRFSQLD